MEQLYDELERKIKDLELELSTLREEKANIDRLSKKMDQNTFANNWESDSEILRQKAIELLSENQSYNSKFDSKTKATSMHRSLDILDELRIHQFELEMQYDEIAASKNRAEIAEQKYKDLYYFAPTGYITMSQNGIIEELNHAATEMLGKKNSHLTNASFGFFVSKETLPIFNLFLEKVFSEKQKETCEIILDIKDKLPVYLMITGIVDRSGNQCIVNLIDITGKSVAQAIKESAEKLRISDNDFKRAQSIAHIGHWKWYLDRNEVVWSDELFHIFGIDKNSYTGLLQDVITKIIHPDDLHKILPENGNEFVRQKPIEYRIILPDKSIRNIWAMAGESQYDNAGKPLFLTGIAQDITERKNAEIALKQSEAKNTAILNALPDLIFIQNKNGDYLDFHANEKKDLILQPEDFLGRNMREVLPSEILKDFTGVFNEAIETKHIQKFEYSVLIAGDLKYFDSRITAYEEDKILNITRNVTESKQKELIINAQNKELIKLNADKDRFISILAHDLKSPFNVLLGFSEILSLQIQHFSKEQIQKQADYIFQAATKTYILLEDILNWAKAQAGKIPFVPQPLDFLMICDEILEVLCDAAGMKKITVTHFLIDDIKLLGDANMLKTILRNLVSNAIKFTENGGSIQIYAEKNHTHAFITVSDNGVGIPCDVLKKLFDISHLQTTSGTENEKGTGFGLLLCKEFVEKHGGKIWVESKEGIGSDFKFTFPLCT